VREEVMEDEARHPEGEQSRWNAPDQHRRREPGDRAAR